MLDDPVPIENAYAALRELKSRSNCHNAREVEQAGRNTRELFSKIGNQVEAGSPLDREINAGVVTAALASAQHELERLKTEDYLGNRYTIETMAKDIRSLFSLGGAPIAIDSDKSKEIDIAQRDAHYRSGMFGLLRLKTEPDFIKLNCFELEENYARHNFAVAGFALTHTPWLKSYVDEKVAEAHGIWAEEQLKASETEDHADIHATLTAVINRFGLANDPVERGTERSRRIAEACVRHFLVAALSELDGIEPGVAGAAAIDRHANAALNHLQTAEAYQAGLDAANGYKLPPGGVGDGSSIAQYVQFVADEARDGRGATPRTTDTFVKANTAKLEAAETALRAFETSEEPRHFIAIVTQTRQLERMFESAIAGTIEGSETAARIIEAEKRVNLVSAHAKVDILRAVHTAIPRGDIKEMNEDVRQHLASANMRIVDGSSFDRQLERLTCRAFLMSGRAALRNFENFAGVTALNIDATHRTIVGLFEAGGHPVEEGSVLDRRLLRARRDAHIAVAMDEFAKLQDPAADFTVDQISALKTNVRRHLQQGDSAFIANSSFDRLLEKNAQSACLVNGDKLLKAFEDHDQALSRFPGSGFEDIERAQKNIRTCYDAGGITRGPRRKYIETSIELAGRKRHLAAAITACRELRSLQHTTSFGRMGYVGLIVEKHLKKAGKNLEPGSRFNAFLLKRAGRGRDLFL